MANSQLVRKVGGNAKYLHYSWILVTFSQLGYYTCYTPFKIKADPRKGGFHLHANTIQKVLCGISCVMFISVNVIFQVRTMWENLIESSSKGQGNCKHYLQTINIVSYLLLESSMAWILWRKPTAYLELIKLLEQDQPMSVGAIQGPNRKPPPKLAKPKQIKRKVWLVLICTITIALTIMCLILPEWLRSTANLDNFKDTWIKEAHTRGRHYFNLPETDTEIDDEKLSASEITLIVFALLDQFNSSLRNLGRELFIVAGYFTFWQHCRDFKNLAKQSSDFSAVDWSDLYKRYKKVKLVSGHLNNMFGLGILTYTISTFFYYSTNLDTMFIEENYCLRVLFYFNCITGISIYWLAASSIYYVKSLKVLIAQKHISFKILPRQWLLATHELEHFHSVALSGCVFQVTFSFLGNMMSTVGTYFLICVESDSKTQLQYKLKDT